MTEVQGLAFIVLTVRGYCRSDIVSRSACDLSAAKPRKNETSHTVRLLGGFAVRLLVFPNPFVGVFLNARKLTRVDS
jgi:hypothetical protein